VTTLRALSDASAVLPVGSAWASAFETRDANGYLTSAVTPTVLVTRPDGSTAAPVPLSLTYAGGWYVLYTLAAAGRHVIHVSTPEDALDAAAYAHAPLTAAGMPTVDDVAFYLRSIAGTWTTVELQDALNAERSAQRDRCGERAIYPDALRQALLRRVSRNLAMRLLPLAVNTGDADAGPTILPGNDPEVRRLEAPYRRLVMG
jgi:hypothetical protein